MTAPSLWPLEHAGPAQSEWLIHFCARPPGTGVSQFLSADVARQTPQQRLDNILWEQRLCGSVVFGATQPTICLSESPLDHFRWLLAARQFHRGGLLLSRQWVYDVGGGPVWYTRGDQYAALAYHQRSWAVRLDTTSAAKSDWLHEREWRIPVPQSNPALVLGAGAVSAILIGDLTWQPTARFWKVPTGRFFNSQTGVETSSDDPDGVPEIQQVPAQHPFWYSVPRLCWILATQSLVPV